MSFGTIGKFEIGSERNYGVRKRKLLLNVSLSCCLPLSLLRIPIGNWLNTGGVHSARSHLKGDVLTGLLTEAVAGWTGHLKNMVYIFNQSEF